MAAQFKRIIMVVVDGLGIGSAPDASIFADQGADTLGSLVRHFRARLQLPTLTRLGLGVVRGADHGRIYRFSAGISPDPAG